MRQNLEHRDQMLRDRSQINASQDRDEWNIGIVDQPITDIVNRGLIKPIRWLARDSWRILADPFVYQHDNGRYHVYAEMLNHWTGRGEIWSAVLPADGSLKDSDFKPFATNLAHLSYPSVIGDGKSVYLTMEMADSGGLHLWQLAETPHYIGCLIDRPVLDPTFYHNADGWWLFCTILNDQPNERLYVYYADELTGPWRPLPDNPVKTDLASVRPGGRIIEMEDGRLIRPTQDCVAAYGSQLTFNQILQLTRETFSEVAIRTLGPTDEYYADGLHTIASAGKYTVIDGRCWHRGPLPNLTRRVVAKCYKIRRLSKRKSMVGSMLFPSERGPRTKRADFPQI